MRREPEQKQIAMSEKIVLALEKAPAPMSVDELCKNVFGKIGQRERNVVHQNLHRLDEKGRIEKFAMRYRLRLPGGG